MTTRRWLALLVLIGYSCSVVVAFVNPYSQPVVETHGKRIKSSLQAAKSKIITGPQGKPAVSKEEDLRLTIQVIREFHGLDQPPIIEEKEDDVTVQEQEEEEQEEETKAPPAASVIETEVEVNLEEIIERLSRPSYAASLKRIAAGMAPAAGQALLPINKIESISIIRLETTEIELAALVCEGGDCVNIAIPVTFPIPCESNDQDTLEECILDNIDQLDQLATAGIQQAEVTEENYEQVQSDERMRAELQDETIRPVLPDWWTEPTGDWQMQDECGNVKDLLNDDEFASEILALAEKHELMPSDMKITHAAVAFVGTSGALLRANVEGVDADGDPRTMIVDLPVAFPSGKAITANALRLSVLSLVDDIQ